MTNKELFTAPEAGEYIGGKPAATLRQWRYLNKGPAFVKVGRSVRYRRSDLDAWLLQQTVTPNAA